MHLFDGIGFEQRRYLPRERDVHVEHRDVERVQLSPQRRDVGSGSLGIRAAIDAKQNLHGRDRYRTMAMGVDVLAITFDVTEPRTRLFSGDLPWDPITIMSALNRSATSRTI